MITEGHAAVLARALGELLGAPEPGTVAYLRCLSSVMVDGLATESVFEVPGFAVRAVVDREDATGRLITADRAVELREDKGDPLVLVIDPRRAGAGLDGICSAGREVTEHELFQVANDLAREQLGHGRIGFAREAVRAARRVGRRVNVTPWQEFDFLVMASGSAEAMGGAVVRLGLWPIAIGDRPEGGDLDLSAAMVNRLLVDRDATTSSVALIDTLMLEDHPQLWLKTRQPGFASDELRAIEIVAWRNDKGKLLAWSGLHDSADGKPRFRIDPGAADQKKAS